MSIELLRPDVIDQIAAGEVLERPANLVKELVENSIDAGASEIEVEFEQGGRWVKIRDNGCGIEKKDLPLAFARHATSKIKEGADLWRLHSYGFRGEALASISSVSRISITSKTSESSSAAIVSSHFGQISEVTAASALVGTTVLVDELFSNVPARLKFLKSEGAESSQIRKVLKAMALANPKVGFRIKNKGKLIFYWHPQPDDKKESLQKRAEQILEVNTLYIGEADRGNVHAMAVFSSPNDVQATSQNIWIFVQGRWVQDRSLQAAVMEAYRNLLMHGEYPNVSVWVTLPADEVDVNIHPTKAQVKFQDSAMAFRAVQASIRDALEKAPWIQQKVAAAKTLDIRQDANIIKQVEFQPLQFNDQSVERVQYAKKEMPSNSNNNDTIGVKEILAKYRAPVVEFRDSPQRTFSENIDGFQRYWSNLEVLGQLNNTYILAQSRNSLLLVDQHAAHERVAFEKINASFKSGNKLECQELLIPLRIGLDAAQVEGLLTQKESLQKLGVEIEQSGPEEVAVNTIPLLIKESALQDALQKLAHQIVEQGAGFALEKVLSDIFATMACHSVVRAGQTLSKDEMQSLLKSMDEFSLSSFCPHGRPVYVEYSFNELEKDFGRIV